MKKYTFNVVIADDKGDLLGGGRWTFLGTSKETATQELRIALYDTIKIRDVRYNLVRIS